MIGTHTGSILLSCFLLAGCATVQDAYSPDSLNRRITTAQDHWRAHGTGFQLPAQATAVPSPELQRLLDPLLAASPLRGFPVRAFLVSDPEPNAFTNGTDIYMHTGMLQLAGNDSAVLAGILAHELGHIIGNHVRSQVTRAGVETLLAALGQASGRQEAGPLLEQVLGMTSSAYSRRDEKEADVIGTALLHKAGWDSGGLVRYFEYSRDRKAADVARFQATLTPLVTSYNQAVSNYQAYLGHYHQTGAYQSYAYASGWAQTANGYAAQIQTLLAQYQQYLNATHPLYMSHPPDQERIHTISLIRTKEVQGLDLPWLLDRDPSVARAYEILHARSPRS